MAGEGSSQEMPEGKTGKEVQQRPILVFANITASGKGWHVPAVLAAFGLGHTYLTKVGWNTTCPLVFSDDVAMPAKTNSLRGQVRAVTDSSQGRPRVCEAAPGEPLRTCTTRRET